MSRLLFCIVLCLSTSVYAGGVAHSTDQNRSDSDAIGPNQGDDGDHSNGNTTELGDKLDGLVHLDLYVNDYGVSNDALPQFVSPANFHFLNANIHAIRAPPCFVSSPV